MATISVIMPVHNGRATLDRAVGSVTRQSFSDWELVIVDDGSTDESLACAQGWQRGDPRIRVIALDRNLGVSPARNAGLRAAASEYVSYLDCDDEYYPDYFEKLMPLLSRADVTVSSCDVIDTRRGETAVAGSWVASHARNGFFSGRVCIPLVVAHRRSLIFEVGLFNELLWLTEDHECWERLARRGAEFLFLPIKSGVYRRRAGSQSNSPNVPESQRDRILANRAAGRPLYEQAPTERKPARKSIALVSPLCVFDASCNGSIALLRGLRMLCDHGFRSDVFCGSIIATTREQLSGDALVSQETPHSESTVRLGSRESKVIFCRQGPVTASVWYGGSADRLSMSSAEGEAFIEGYYRFLRMNRPEAVIVNSGDAIGSTLARIAKSFDIPVVFWLHNLRYGDVTPFRQVDYVVVPSDFVRRWYWARLGLACHVLPNAVEGNARPAADGPRRYLTLVRPRAERGLRTFMRIMDEIERRRPDIPLQAIEDGYYLGRSEAEGRSDEGTVQMRRTRRISRPREYHESTRVLLIPAEWDQSCGLAAADAMFDGIPVVVSDRGELPEVVADAGTVLPILDRSVDASATRDVEPWVEAVVRLWDFPREYEAACERSQARAQDWAPGRVAPAYFDFFSSVTPQPFPPIAPPGVR